MYTLFWKLLRLMLPYKYKVLGSLLCLFLSAALAMRVPVLIGMSVDALNSADVDMFVLYGYIAVILGLICVKSVLVFLSRYMLIGVSRLIEHKIRYDVFAHLMGLSLSFFDKYKTADLMSRMMQDLEHLRAIFGPGIMYSMNVCFLLFFALWNIAVIDLGLAAIVLFLFSCSLIFLRFLGKYYYAASQNLQEELSGLSSFVGEHLGGVRVIKAYAKERLVEKSLRQQSMRYIQKHLLYGKLHGLFRPILFFIVHVAAVLVIWIAGNKVLAGEMSVGVLIEFLVYIEMLSVPSVVMGFVLAIFYRGAAAYMRIDEILSVVPDIDDKAVITRGSVHLDRSIVFRNLSFSYPLGKQPIIQNVSFSVRSGEKLAILGPTGCGKTMLLALLLRLYAAPENSIFVGGRALETIPLADLRAHIACVPQEHILFQNTIYENIRFGQEYIGANLDLHEVTRVACIDKQIAAFPEGYDTFVGEGGVTLSGGQKQRLSISRALARKAGILVFDDSFSSVDTETESILLQNIYQAFPNITLIIVAHRISTIQSVDTVVVLNRGSVEDIGSPAALEKRNPYYKHLLAQESFHTFSENLI